KNNLARYGIWDESFGQKIVPLKGDLSSPLLGLSTGTWQELEERIDVIYHGGAEVNFMIPYEEAKFTNVYGTKDIIRLATSKKVKPVHYISTLSVFAPSSG